MTTEATQPAAGTKSADKLEKLRPTLFIGVGGTGMEVLLRVRRHIVSELWGSGQNRHRIDSIAEFPVAQFINFDLDSGAITQSDKSQKQDTLFDLVKFTDEERLVESFDIEKYSRDDDSLGRYPHIKAWSPLTPKKIREMNIDPSKGAGQIRAISRLYFFDKYPKIKDMIRLKLRSLKSGLSKDHQLKKLQLELAQDKFRVVVICSVAGGTGSGSFLDMGWLATWIARMELSSAEIELMVFLPSGFQSANKDRTEANSYAALMELETAMRGSLGAQYVGRWDAYDKPELSTRPYDEIYLIDSGNVAQQHTSNVSDVYQMVADALFEDFASADFANKKRSIAVNQRQHKIVPLSPPVTVGRYGDMKLTYSKGFSSFGQSMLDTQQSDRREIRANVWAGEMLKAFFGVSVQTGSANRSTDKVRDEFMSEHMFLKLVPFSDIPKFVTRVDLKRSAGEFVDYLLTEQLLTDRSSALIPALQQKVDARLEAVKQFKCEDWAEQIRETLRQLERDTIRDQDATADVSEDRVTRQRQVQFRELKEAIEAQLFAYLDNKEFGGLEFVLSLVEQIKDRLENPATGLISGLSENSARYAEIRDVLRTNEFEQLMKNLAQTKGFMSWNEKNATLVLDHIKEDVSNYLKFHLRSKAASEAARLLADLSKWLGERTGVDDQGRTTWTGLVGQFQAGRESVVEMLKILDSGIESMSQELKKEHATYIRIDAPDREIPLPKQETLREFADDAFKDFGGSKVLFEMLEQDEGRESLLLKVRRVAERRIGIAGAELEEASEQTDPLVAALEQMSPVERQRRFKELLIRAMPWIDANLSRDIQLKADQFKCFIGVANSPEFAKKFKSEIETAIPTFAGITSSQVAIVETGAAGRATCYCELSGIPLTVMRGLDAWRTSYRKESENIPVHTHIDSTQFTHPIVPTMDELNALADDFKAFLLAVMTGVLTRSTQQVTPPGQYQFMVRRGETLKMGNERAFRLNGLPRTYREQIIGTSQERLDSLDEGQMALLAILAEHYEQEVYAPRLVPDETGLETTRKGFASAMAGELARDLRERARRKGFEQGERAIDIARSKLNGWTRSVEGSDADAYEWEVREATPESGPRLKLTVRTEFFEAAWAKQWFAAMQQTVNPTIAPIQILPGSSATPPPLPGAPLPASYLVAINGQQAGPYSALHIAQFVASGRLNLQTLVWKQGMPTWVPLGQVPELAAQIAPPPLPGGVPPIPLA